MSISMGHWGSAAQFATYDPYAGRLPWPVWTVHCRQCGYQAPGRDVAPPRACPRCHTGAFERIPLPQQGRRHPTAPAPAARRAAPDPSGGHEDDR